MARRQTYVGPDLVRRRFTSARLTTAGRFAFRYGRVEARIRVPAGRGLWPAFWTLGAAAPGVGWPHSGEVDLMETRGDRPRLLKGTVIGPRGDGGGHWDAPVYRRVGPGWHVYGMRWSPGIIRLTLDGRVYSSVTEAQLPRGWHWVFDRPQFLLLNLAVGGTFPGPPSASTRFPATMLVDWVRVWRSPSP